MKLIVHDECLNLIGETEREEFSVFDVLQLIQEKICPCNAPGMIQRFYSMMEDLKFYKETMCDHNTFSIPWRKENGFKELEEGITFKKDEDGYCDDNYCVVWKCRTYQFVYYFQFDVLEYDSKK